MASVASEIYAREPSRGDDGKFQAKVAAPGAPEATQVPGQSQAAPPAPAPLVIEAPQSWPADVKGKWAALPPDIQKYVSDREGEVHKKFTTDGERLNVLSAIEQATAPFAERLREVGVPQHEYFRNLMSFDVGLKQDPLGAVRALEAYTGLNFAQLSQYAGQQPQPGQQPVPQHAQHDPRLNALHNQVQTLQKQNEDARLSAATQQINEFKAGKPHFDKVEPLMSQLIAGGVAKGLQDAYEQAIKIDPDVSAALAAEASAAALKKAEDEAKERSSKDRRVAPFARRPGSAPTAPTKGNTIWDTLKSVGKEVTAR